MTTAPRITSPGASVREDVMPEETRVGFHRDLEEIDQKVVQLFALVAESVAKSTEAFLANDREAAESLVDADAVIDELYCDVEELVQRQFALQSPMARDMRFLLSVLRIVPELERSGALGVALVAVVVWALTSRRAFARRMSVLATRLGDAGAALSDSQGLEAAVSAVERAADESALRVDRSASAAERLAQALDALHQGVVLCDEEGRVVYRNLLAESFAGARHAEALAEQAITDVLKASALEGEQHSRTVDLYGPPRRNLHITAVPLSDGTRSVGAVAVIEDVSERKRLEAVRRDFVANVSHELKTPVGALGLLAETLADEDDAAVIRRLAHRMQAEAVRVGRIIHDLLDLSRLESEESPEREPVGVHVFVGQAVEQVRSAAEARGVELEVAEIGRRVTVPGDRRQLVSAGSHRR